MTDTRTIRTGLLAVACLLTAPAAVRAADGPAFGPEARAEFAVKPKQVFAFTRKPTVRRRG